MNYKLAMSSIVLIILSGCQSFQRIPISPIDPITEVSRYPETGTISKAELGDSVSYYELESTEYGARLLDAVQAAEYLDGTKPYLPPQELFLIGKYQNQVAFNAPHCTVAVLGNFGSSTTSSDCFSPLLYDEESKKWSLPSLYTRGQSYQLDTYQLETPINAEIFSKVIVNAPNFRQELIYNGKVDNSVKFIYRELAAGILRDAFTQEVQYDLNEGDIIGFKGVRLRIIEATNQQIEYILIEPFEGEPL